MRFSNGSWVPLGSKPHDGPLGPGMLVPQAHKVWRVMEVTPKPIDQWDDDDNESVRLYGLKAAPLLVRGRGAQTPRAATARASKAVRPGGSSPKVRC